MSGICGVVGLDGSPVPVSVVLAMSAAAPHLGTKAVLWTHSSGVLTSQRRAAADADGGRARPAAGIVVVADARIDNGRELRDALTRSGHPPIRTDDPDDLIRAAYLAWGEDCAPRLLGDFAFVVWDVSRGTVFAARDPLAMRNLYYRREARRLLFATEAKQLLAVPGVPDAVDEGAVFADLIGDFGRADRTFYEGIEQLAPGSALTCGSNGCSTRRFWDVDPNYRLDTRDREEAAEELRRVFTQAVADRLDAHAPTGILLSGGVDSGSVASAAGWLRDRDLTVTPALHAFSWAFHELPECDERHVSRLVVEHYGLRSTEVPADGAGPLSCYPEHGPDRDDPFLGAFQPLIEHSLEAASNSGVAVLLGGDRGDLVIGNTGISYLQMLLAGQWAELPAALREHHLALQDPWSRIVRRHLAGALAQRLRQRSPLEWAAWTAGRVRGSLSQPAPVAVPEWIQPAFLQRMDRADVRAAVAPPDGLGHARDQRYRHVFTPLHLRGVAWSNRTYARYGLGFADPFSDRRVVELALALPTAAINRPGEYDKPLMRAAVRGVMPEQARRSAAKILPSPLYEQSLRLRASLVRSLIAEPLVEERGWVDGAALRLHFEGWLGGGRLRPEFWWAIQVETWLRAHHG